MTIDPILFYLAAVLVIASLKDIQTSRIPNWLTYSAFAVGISYFSVLQGYEGFLFSFKGLAIGLGFLFLPYIFGVTGAGDVKLLGAVGSFLGPKGITTVFILSCILGSVYGILLMASKGLLFGTFKRYGLILKGFITTQQLIYISPSKKEKEIKIKYALAIALGTGLYLFWGGLRALTIA